MKMEKHGLPVWMQKTLGILIIVLLLLIIIEKVGNINHLSQTLRITATGQVTAVPDQAVLTVGVESQGTDVVDVKNKNNEKMNQVIDFIKDQGVDKKDIQTT